MNEYHLKYLDVIQSVISRMASNQFQARAWSVALGSAVIGFAASKDGNPHAAALALVPVMLFWWMDAYFLALEHGYRALYNQASEQLRVLLAENKDEPPSFSLAPEAGMVPATIATACRPAVIVIHLPVVLLAIGVALQIFPALRPAPRPPAQPMTCVCAR
jgi:hypothetical protein